MAPATPTLTTKADSGSPYQLDRSQILKASTALLKHIKSEAKRKEASSQVKSLLATDENNSDEESLDQPEPVWLVLTTKKHVVDKKRLKPGKIPLAHSLNKSSTSTMCLITPDPQRKFKDVIAHPAFPTTLSSQLTRIIGIEKLKARYKSFESRRQLLSEHDIFLADDRVVTLLPRLLGKTFFESTKRPLPVNLQPNRPKDSSGKSIRSPKNTNSKSVAPPEQVAKELERALSCAQVHLSPSTTTAVRVAWSNFKAEEVADNIEAVVKGMEEKFITKGWRNIRAIHIKGPNTMALPVWLASELWVEEKDILEDAEAKAFAELASQKGKKRKPKGGDDRVADQKKKPRKLDDSDMSKEMAERREKLRQQKREAMEEANGEDAVLRIGATEVGDVDEARAKAKKRKTVVAMA